MTAHRIRKACLWAMALVVVTLGFAESTTAATTDGQVPPVKRAAELPVRQFVIRFRDEVRTGRAQRPTATALASLERAAGIELRYRRPMADLAHVLRLAEPLPRAQAERLLQRLRASAGVLDIEIDEYEFPYLEPNDTLYNDARDSQWHLKAPNATRPGAANLPGAWDIARGEGVVVAVIDTGIVGHSDLDTNVVKGYDFISADPDGRFLVANDGDGRDADPADPGDWIDDVDLKEPIFAPDESGSCDKADSSWHGTHVAGTIAALTDNTTGVAGIAHRGKVLVVRALGKCFGYGSDISDAIRWAAGAAPASGSWSTLGLPENARPARVINLSLGTVRGSCPPTRQSAIDAARAAGAVIVAATGNESSNTISQPANCQGVIAVTAHTNEGDKANYANAGTGTSLSAPGGGNCSTSALNCLPAGGGGDGTLWRFITSTLNNGRTVPGTQRYDGFQGTSMAAPHVSGVAALLLSKTPTLKPDTVRSLLVNSTRPFPDGTWCAGRVNAPCGAGMLDATRALQRLIDLSPIVSASASSSGSGANTLITLNGRAEAKPGANTLFSFRWRQTSGPAVTLSATDTAQVSFSAPTSARFGFELTAVDADGLAGQTTLTFGSNGTPVVAPISAINATLNSSVSFTVVASDPDGDALTLQASGLPSGANFNASTGAFSWPSASPAGTYTVSFTASDGTLTSVPLTVTITVSSPSSGGTGGGGNAGSSGGGGSLDAMFIALGLLYWLGRRGESRPRRSLRRIYN